MTHSKMLIRGFFFYFMLEELKPPAKRVEAQSNI